MPAGVPPEARPPGLGGQRASAAAPHPALLPACPALLLLSLPAQNGLVSWARRQHAQRRLAERARAPGAAIPNQNGAGRRAGQGLTWSQPPSPGAWRLRHLQEVAEAAGAPDQEPGLPPSFCLAKARGISTGGRPGLSPGTPRFRDRLRTRALVGLQGASRGRV